MAALMGMGLVALLQLGQRRSAWMLAIGGMIAGGCIYATASWALGSVEMRVIGGSVWRRLYNPRR